MRFLAPVGRHAGITGIDTRAGIKRLQTGKMRKDAFRTLPGVALVDAIVRIGSGYGEDGNIQRARSLFTRTRFRDWSLHAIALGCARTSYHSVAALPCAHRFLCLTAQ